jgi:hypothetical protein
MTLLGRLPRLRGGPSPRRELEHHFEECLACAALYAEISSTLTLCDDSGLPERGDQYGLEVWQRIRHRLPERSGGWVIPWLRRDRLALAAVSAALLMAAFVAGRAWRWPAGPPDTRLTPATGSARQAVTEVTGAPGSESRQRILLTSVADHLDRSERVLTDIMNSSTQDDISAEQRRAEDLLSTSRLYRQDAVEAGEESVAGVLDELERSLLEIVHSPSRLRKVDLEQIRRRIDAAALLFKVRIMSDDLRKLEESAPGRRLPKTTQTRTS